MVIMSKLTSLLFCAFAFLTCVAAVENSVNGNGVSGNITAVLLDNSAAFAVCVYPASGAYSFLNRLLYYCTLIFSLFSRAHLWLVAGALAAALTYSGSAAVHACLLVWRGPNPYIENDSWVLYTILNSACLITVPLLNWSGTLRRLGAKAASIRDPKRAHTQSGVSTRTIVIYWAFLVLVGFICIWQQVLYGQDESNMEYPDMSKVMCAPGTNASTLLGADGTPHRRAIDIQFTQDNGCSDPCNQINIPSIFRQQNDLVLLDHRKALLWNQTLPGRKYQQAEKFLTAENKLFNLDYFTLPFILVQGFITAFFGRRDPREIRDLIYIKLFMGQQPLSRKPFLIRTQDIFARVIAALNYILAVAVILFCPPLFIVSVLSSEIQFWNQQPDAEAPYSVGQWEPWVVTCQVLLAALIARYHDKVICFICDTWRHFGFSFHHRHRHHQDLPQVKEGDDEEQGRVSIPDSSSSPKSTLNPNPHAGEPDLRPTERPILSPLQQQQQPDHKHQQGLPNRDHNRDFRTLWHQLRASVYHGYKMLSHPLNESDRGLFDEISNFWRWCRDPMAVSRLVVRHPMRPRDGEREMGMDGYEGVEEGEKREIEGEEGFGKEGAGNGDRVDDEGTGLGAGVRLDSGFFRGRSLHDGGTVKR